MTKSESDVDRVSKWWAQTPEQFQQRALTNWMGHNHVRSYINRRITGDKTLDWLSYVIRKYFQTPVQRALSLGCGDGGLERHALAMGAVNYFDAYDVSEGAIESARRVAEEADLLGQIRYAVTDLNQLELSQGVYDAIFASMSIHHIQSLEIVFSEVRKALTPSGLFIINEYIGPTRFQLPANQLDVINELLRILPLRYRRLIRDGNPTDEVKQTHSLHTHEWFAENDPSEAVRSGELLPLLREFFEVVEFKPYGGALLHFLLENIVGNFNDDREDDRAWLNMMEYVESALEQGQQINSDFAMIVARSKKDGESGK